MQDGERYLTLNGIRHWCRVDGGGRSQVPIVALHGGPGGNHYVFERTVVPRLRAFATLVCYEQRGCGRSDAPPREDDYTIGGLVSDLEQLREALAFPRMVLLGYSFCGELALEYALAHPSRSAALILQAPSGIVDDERAALVQIHGFAELGVGPAPPPDAKDPDGSPMAVLDEIWRRVDTPTVDRFLFVDPAVARRNRTLWQESGLVNTGLMERALTRERHTRTPLRQRIQAVTVPTLILVGRRDRNIGVDACREATVLMRDARLHVFEDSGHFPDMPARERMSVRLAGSVRVRGSAMAVPHTGTAASLHQTPRRGKGLSATTKRTFCVRPSRTNAARRARIGAAQRTWVGLSTYRSTLS